MIPAQLRNPFLAQAVDDTVTLPAGHVPELHAAVLAKCNDALTHVYQTGQRLGVLVVGEAGSGKSHLIAQLRQQVATDPKVIMVAVRLYGAYAGHLWRHVREHLFVDLLRQYPNPAHGANGLLRLLRNRFPKWASVAQGAGGLLDWLVGRGSSASNLQPHLDDFARSCALNYKLQKVLPKVASPEVTSLAHAWLRGQQLGSEDLQLLGLPGTPGSDLERETESREVVLSFLRLASDKSVIFLCFDQVEAIQAGTYDPIALRDFTTLESDLLAEHGSKVVATFIRPRLQVALQQAVEKSNIEKIAQVQAGIPPLSRGQVFQIARARLDAESTCRAERAKRSGDLDWPLATPFLESTFDQHKRSLTPRHLLSACANEFTRLQKGGPPPPEPSRLSDPEPKTNSSPPKPSNDAPRPPDTSPPLVRADEFLRGWDNQRKKYLERVQGVSFDTVLAIGLPWLIGLRELPFVRVDDKNPRLGDVNLIFQPHARRQKPLGVSFCNHEPKLLWRRLDRLSGQWQTARNTALGSLVLLRSELERTTEAAESRFTALQNAGVRYIRLDRQQLAELAAFQSLHTKAHEGNLMRNGRPIDPTEYDGWAKVNLSDAVQELLNDLFDGAFKQAATPESEARLLR